MRQAKVLHLALRYAILNGPCRLPLAPAGSWLFPTLSPQHFSQVPGPLSRWASMVLLPVSSHRNIDLPQANNGSAFPQYSVQRLQYGSAFGTAVIPLCSGPRVCSPLRSLPPKSKLNRGGCDFSIRAPHGSLPPRAPNMLVVRTGQLTTGDFHPIKIAALSAAPFAFAHLSESYLPRSHAVTFPKRSLPWLFTNAALGGLKPAPASRLRGAKQPLSFAQLRTLYFKVRSWHTTWRTWPVFYAFKNLRYHHISTI